MIGVKPELRQEYLRLHPAVWPQVEKTITANDIRNYTIFIHHDLLIAYFEYVGDDFDADMALMGADATTQECWQLTEACQTTVAGESEQLE